MKQFTLTLATLCLSGMAFAQHSGNANYQTQVRYSDNNINIPAPVNNDLTISVKGMANIKPDAYVAIFSVSQTGKTTEEVNKIIDERIETALQGISDDPSVETYVDMISFVPVYNYEVEKKIFSKKTYNEIPAGFEVTKNIHVKYTDPNTFNTIMSDFSQAEIYDLVRVDYFSEDIGTMKKELAAKAKTIFEEKFTDYESIIGIDLEGADRIVSDGYRVVLPVEMYKSYQAYKSSSLNLKKAANVNQAAKSTTLYYQPLIDKEFDFVINATVLEPVIQVMYELNVRVDVQREKEKVEQQEPTVVNKTEKKYILVTPNGDVKPLNL
ncbi:MAG: SIMPL domain-containing protein [bacterium]|nr:SIMPL domain-containing protein [bacterium]